LPFMRLKCFQTHDDLFLTYDLVVVMEPLSLPHRISSILVMSTTTSSGAEENELLMLELQTEKPVLLFNMAGVSEIINVGRIKKIKKCEAY
jgi:hypothetical protein